MSEPKTFKHTFTYTAPEAKSVLVTGTFDNWSKTQTLEYVDNGVFSATVLIPYETPGQDILYKYVVDEHWLTDSKTETTTDDAGNVNNILHAPIEPEPTQPTVTEANVADAGPEQTKQEPLPPLFVPPVVLPSDRAAYEAAVAKGDNEVVKPQLTNLESFPVVENDLDRTNSPVIVEPPHTVQEPEHDKVAEPPVATPPENIEALTEPTTEEQAATNAVEQPSETTANAEPAAANTEAAPNDTNANNVTDAAEATNQDIPAKTDAPAPEPTLSTTANGHKKIKEKKNSLGSKIKGFFKKL
ncbi:hypothetical protein BGW37DRAFT_477405 [Umbelopsis sp. PMI_123]|nr:hypothetical protein BGW37DRAFT_477405 [Umbelopsis sp. PMI_123]